MKPVACLAAALLLSFTPGCGGGGGGSSGGGGTPPTPTSVEIEVDISRTINEPDQTTLIEWSVAVQKDGVPVDTATVAINGTNVPLVGGFTAGWYDLTDAQGANYLVGQNYAVTVSFGGNTYSDTMKAPGGLVIDAQGSTVTWPVNGTFASVLVTHLFGATTFTTPVPSPAPLSSPLAIPASAYPTADTYQINAGVQNVRLPADAYPGFGYFGALVGHKTHFVVEDFRVKRVTK